MPNKHSNQCHKPIRTCVVCRQKSAQDALLPFVKMPAGLVYDLCAALNTRKYYHCAACLKDLPTWHKKMQKKRSRLHA